jgi:hypothetical protein
MLCGGAFMEDPVDGKVLLLEMEIICDEAMKNHARLELDRNRARHTMALVQVDVCQGLMKYLAEAEDWSHFPRILQDAVDGERSRYSEARAADDRKASRVALARIRILQTLTRRLADPKRRQLVAFEPGGPVMVN